MKKALLASTALVGAALLMASPAAADKHKAPKAKPVVTHAGKGTSVKLTGGFDFQAGFIDQDQQGGGDLGSPDRGYAFITNSEIAINARGATDAGMKWRAKVEIETDTDQGTNIDELQLTLSGSWGALVMGNEDGPEDLMDYGADQAIGGAGSGGVSGDWKDFTNSTSVSSRLMVEATLGGDRIGVDSSDATKIVYYTPRINGLQLGVGFVPDTGASGDAKTASDSGDAETFFGLGANYVQKFDGFNVAIGATGAIADTETTSGGSTFEDVRAWRIGAVLGFGAFKIGGGYQDVGDSRESTDDDDATEWDVGIGFKQGPFKAGVGYLHSEVEDGSDEDELDVVTLGATYTLGKGLVVYADVWWLSTEEAGGDDGDDNDAYGLLIGTTVSF